MPAQDYILPLDNPLSINTTLPYEEPGVLLLRHRPDRHANTQPKARTTPIQGPLTRHDLALLLTALHLRQDFRFIPSQIGLEAPPHGQTASWHQALGLAWCYTPNPNARPFDAIRAALQDHLRLG